ncbi:uncharacterized protein LOC129798902 [Phlebotomus papatasi]|uniref:uncharacterized protein LOC129798902 n=1 Tax=Phlebotomus papatasi TaxID=29031 RepID=UPI00248365A6|nr:uncharacterized protein LOC129798902 [Phlebotomus papatasi]
MSIIDYPTFCIVCRCFKFCVINEESSVYVDLSSDRSDEKRGTIMEKLLKFLVISVSVLNFCLREIYCKPREDLARSIISGQRGIEEGINIDDNNLFASPASKFIPAVDDEDNFSDYPSSYYGNPSNKFLGLSPGGHFPGVAQGLGLAAYGLSLWKIKLMLLSVGKILLKLFFVKLIIKFIVVVFILIFNPSMFSIFSPDEFKRDDAIFRKFNYEKSRNERINNLASFVLSSIDTFQRATNCKNVDEEFQCRLLRMFNMINNKYPFTKLLKMYRMKLDAEDKVQGKSS